MTLEELAAKARAMDATAQDCPHEWDRDYVSRIVPGTGSERCIRCGTRREWAESAARRAERPQEASEGVEATSALSEPG